MKVLQLSLHGCGKLGFGPYQPTTRKYPINKKNLVALFIHFLALSSSFAFLFLDANTFQECAMSVYASTMLLLNIGLYFVFIWKNQTICDLLQTFENSVEKRESNFYRNLRERSMLNRKKASISPFNDFLRKPFMISGLEHPTSTANYVKINLTAEKWAKIIYFVYLKVLLQAIMIPKLVFCFYLYFTTDKGNDAFELPFLSW